MTFSSSTDPKVLKEELALLESLTQKAIEGSMEVDDFVEFARIFDNVPKAQYSAYMEHILPYLSNENLHKLIDGLAKVVAKEAQGANTNTIFRSDHILKGLLLAEVKRYNSEFGVTYDKNTGEVTMPEAIPDVILDHFAKLVADPNSVGAFDGASGDRSSPEMRQKNIRANIVFNILKTLVNEATVEMEPVAQQTLLQSLENKVGKLIGDIDSKVAIENGVVNVKVKPLAFSPAQTPEGVAGISKGAALKAVAASTNPAYKDLLSKQVTRDQLAKLEADIEACYYNPFDKKGLNNLLEQHKALRKEAGVKYTFGEDSKLYKLLMSGNENTVARLIDQMLKKTDDVGSDDKSKLQVDLNEDVLFKNSPPELLLKMKEVADKLAQREGGKVSNFRDGLNKFANGMKRAFSFGTAGISDAKIKEALEGVESTTTYSDKVSESPKGQFQRQTSGLFTDSVSKKAPPVQMHTDPTVRIRTSSEPER